VCAAGEYPALFQAGRLLRAIEATGRKKLIFAGHGTASEIESSGDETARKLISEDYPA